LILQQQTKYTPKKQDERVSGFGFGFDPASPVI